jgi:hypothetical protein
MAWQQDITDVTIANCWVKSRVLGPQMTPITRWQAEQGGWRQALEQDEQKLATVIQGMQAALHRFKDQNRIKEVMDIHQFIEPEVERVEDPIDEANLVEEIAASYSLVPEDEPDEDPDPIVPIRPSQALAAIDIVRQWEEQQNDSTNQVIRQIQAIEKRIQRAQVSGLQQRTLDSYIR